MSASVSLKERLPSWAALAAVVAVTAFAFLPCLSNGFVNWDDHEYVLENPWIRGWTADNLWAIWTQSRGANYHPLVFMTHLVEHSLWGVSPAGYHAVNLGLHVLATVFFFLLVRDLARREGDGRRALSIAIVAGVGFGVHPVHVESVAWIAERKDVLCGACYLLATWAYVHWSKGRRFGWGLAVWGAYLSALLSKPMAVTWPVVTVLIDLVAGRPRNRRWWLEKTLMALPAVAIMAVTWWIQAEKRGIQPHRLSNVGANLVAAAHAVVFYLAKLFWPAPLSAFYEGPPWGFAAGTTAAVFLCLVLLATWVWVRWRRGDRVPGLGLGWYGITLLPVCGIVPIGFTFAADRYVYLPSAGVLFLVACLGVRWAESPRGRRLLWVPALAAALFLTAATRDRCRVWRDGETLWTDTTRQAPNHLTFRMLGMAQLGMGKLAEAERSLRTSLAYSETQYGRYYLGEILRQQGRCDEALPWFEKFLAEQRWYEPALTGYGLCLMALGRAPEATPVFAECVNRSPGNPGPLVNLGWSLLEQRRFEEAEPVLRLALEQDPTSALALYNMGVLCMWQERHSEAETYYRRVLAKEPGNSRALVNLGVTLRSLGRVAEAREVLGKAARLYPGDAVAANELAKTQADASGSEPPHPSPLPRGERE